MGWIIYPLVALFGCFAFVLLFGAPYLPTLRKQVDTALDLLDLQPGQRLIELGSGDGRILLAAAKRGYHADGYELNPILVAISKWRIRKYKHLATVHWGNYWTADWGKTDGIFFFGLQKFMPKLDKKIIQQSGRPVKLVSFAFTLSDRKPHIAKEGLYLYIYA